MEHDLSAQKPRDFDREAAGWDNEPRRLKMAADVVSAIGRTVPLNPDMDLLDFGCGTGLVGLALRPRVASATCADTSRGMVEVVRQKATAGGMTGVTPLWLEDPDEVRIDGSFDVIVSAMTLHHVPDTAKLIGCLAGLLRPGGWICLADLDPEDGSFHTDPTGVYHHGFDREELCRILSAAGLADAGGQNAACIAKSDRLYSVFLVTGRKPA